MISLRDILRDNRDVARNVPLKATSELSSSGFNDLLNRKNDKRGGNHSQNRLRIVIAHDPFLLLVDGGHYNGSDVVP